MCSELRYVGERADTSIYELMGNAMILAVVGGINDVLRMGEVQGLSRERGYELFDFTDPTVKIRGRGKRMAEDDTILLEHRHGAQGRRAHAGRGPPRTSTGDRRYRSPHACVSERGLGDLDLGAVGLR